MPSIRPEDLTPFGRAALKLDQEFSELVRVGAQLESVDIESDSGLDEGIKILTRAARNGQAIAETMEEFSKSLQEARDKAEGATRLIGERSQLIQKRREQQEQLEMKLAQMKEALKTLGAGLAGFQQPAQGDVSDEDKRKIAEELARLEAPMTRFIEAAQAIKAEAARTHFRRLERQADSMIDSLQASRSKISHAIARKPL